MGLKARGQRNRSDFFFSLDVFGQVIRVGDSKQFRKYRRISVEQFLDGNEVSLALR
jgi:hypothetical protein